MSIELRSCIVSLLFLGAVEAFADQSPALSLIANPHAGLPAKHGFEEMVSALEAKHIRYEIADSLESAHGATVIVTGLAGNETPIAKLLQDAHRAVPADPEALTIQKLDHGGIPLWVIAGADERGLMYAELDAAERIRWSTDPAAPTSELREATEKPDVRNRGVSLFTMNRAYWESRFYDEAYWKRYLDTLAKNRFNSLVVIFGYEDGGFLAPSYPYFFDVPDFPEVKMIGITADQQRQNTNALNHLIDLAHGRGIRLTIGLWDHIYRGGVQGGGTPDAQAALLKPTPNLVWGMTAENLIPYTQTALKRFLKEFPGLDGIQFRMHDESGLKVSEQGKFWRATFQTMKEAAPKLPLDLRAKGLTAGEIQSALDTGVNFHLSTKYWMEQMGLPFHPMHVNPQDQSNRRHSYADLLVYPRKYDVTWQLWNGGTARIFLWGDPEYARRFVASTQLYHGDSFEVDEPLATKMEAQPHDQAPFDLLAPSRRYYDFEFERYWHFFQVFGRIGYNSQTPDEVWGREFIHRFGKASGPHLEKAMHRASWILPRIIASCYPYSGFPMTTGWVEKQRLGDLPTFAKATLSDVQLFENFDEEAQLLVEGGETAKVRPQETSDWLTRTANEISAEVAQAENEAVPSPNREFESTTVDLTMLVELARYHAARIPAAVNYRIYARTKDLTALLDAINGEAKAIAHWKALADAASGVYANDLLMGARSRNLCGNWQGELEALNKGLVDLKHEREIASPAQALTPQPSPHYEPFAANTEKPTITHQPVEKCETGKPLAITAQVKSSAGIKWVQVLYRRVDQTQNYQTLDMKAADDQGTYEAVIPSDKIDSRFDLMYFIQAMDNQHHGVMYPDFQKETPYYILPVERR